jgi:hypothetical protein
MENNNNFNSAVLLLMWLKGEPSKFHVSNKLYIFHTEIFFSIPTFRI